MYPRRTILFLHPTPDRYGADVALLELLRGLDAERWNAVVAIPKDGPLVPLLREAGATVEHGPLGVIERRMLRSPLKLLGFALQLLPALLFVRRLARRHAPALVHTNTSIVVGGAIGAKLTGVPHLWHLHEIARHPRWAAKLSAGIVARLADVAVSNSDATRQNYDELAPSLSAKHRVVLNGIDVARLAPERFDRDAVRAELGLERQAPVIALVGRINGWKGQRLLVEAAEKLRFEFPDARFLIVGEAAGGQGRFVRDLQRDIEARELTGYVRHLPHEDEPARIFVAADVVVVPSTEPEPFGLVAVEAMACGRPVVAAAHGGVLEVVDAGRTGLLFEPGDAQKLAFALKALLEDPRRAQELGAHGRARQEEFFTSARFVRDMDRVWQQYTGEDFLVPESESMVVHITLGKANPERMNGVSAVVHHLASAQRALGLDVEVWGVTPDPDAETPARSYGLRLFAAARSPFTLPGDLARAIDSLPTTAVVHLHGGFVPLMAGVGARLRRRKLPYVVTPHGAYRQLAREHSAKKKAVYVRMHEQALLDGARTVQALSEPEGLEMEDLVAGERVAVIPNGQDALAPIEPRLPAGQTEPRRPLFGFCGRLDARVKGLDTLVDAFARYVANGGQGSLWLVGDGDDRDVLAARAEELGITRRVTIVEPQFGAERLGCVAAFDVFVHPSRHEGMPTAVLEAAALGRPLIVSRGTGLEIEVKEAGAGFAISAVDAEKLAAALAACDREHAADTLQERGASARELIAQSFGWQRIAALVSTDLYELDTTPLAPPAIDPDRAAA